MEERTYIIVDTGSGEVLATHVQVSIEGQASPVDLDELRRGYRAFPGQEVDPGELDVLDVDLDLLKRGTSNERLKVDVASRTLVRPKRGRKAS